MLLLALALLTQDPAALPRVVVRADDTLIERSCRVFIPADLVLADANADGVIQIAAPGVTVVFEEGSVLRGAAPGTPWDQMQGYGVRIRNAEGVTLRGARISGYRGCVWASQAPGLLVEDLVCEDYFRQRLRSSDQAEAGEDWLWPHNNDANEWLRNYGAAVYVEDSAGVTLRRVRARRGQNGICLDRVEEARVYDNDCSFLSGWGLALWRSSRNLVSRNAFDFCVRGYSHGVYSRGQDSAGILCFEQSSQNVFVENSATHGGDGFFGYAGHEALGQNRPPEGFAHERKGCNDNLLIGNDFSYAPAIGIEITFSFGNRLVGNLLRGGNYGVWGGYSQETLVLGNQIEDNGIAGVAIEHGSKNRILQNRFSGNARAVQLWWDVDADLFQRPWARANYKGCVNNEVAHNRLSGDRVGLELACSGASPGVSREMSTLVGANAMEGVGEPLRLLEDAAAPKMVDAPPPPEAPRAEAIGDTRPVGARPALRGRDKIVITEWGPWDHASPLLRRAADAGGDHVYRLHGMSGRPEVELLRAGAGIRAELAAAPSGAGGEWLLTVSGSAPGLHPYRLRVRAPGFEEEAAGSLLRAEWELRVGASARDPMKELEAWREGLRKSGLVARLPALRLRFGNGGPGQAGISEEIAAAKLPADRFGLTAATTVPLAPGRYRLSTLSDDGVRVFLAGRKVIERWDVHVPTRDAYEFKLEQEAPLEIWVEYFENEGYAQLELDLERLD